MFSGHNSCQGGFIVFIIYQFITLVTRSNGHVTWRGRASHVKSPDAHRFSANRDNLLNLYVDLQNLLFKWPCDFMDGSPSPISHHVANFDAFTWPRVTRVMGHSIPYHPALTPPPSKIFPMDTPRNLSQN